jgi:hypothetical protein
MTCFIAPKSPTLAAGYLTRESIAELVRYAVEKGLS